MVGLLYAMAFMVLLLIGWVIWNNKPLPLYLVLSFSQWISVFWKWRFAKFSTSFCVVWVHTWNIQHHWCLSCFQSATVPLASSVHCFLVANSCPLWIMLFFSDCPFHWKLNGVWLCLPLFVVFSSCWEDVIFGWCWLTCWLDTGIRLVCCTLCICFLGLLWSISFRLLSILWLTIPVCQWAVLTTFRIFCM